MTHADGSTTALTVEAPTVVVACGSIESPALLLRSGIGGPAVGKNLRLHPAYLVMGVYDEPVEGWRGQVQSLVSDAYAGLEGDFGFLIEATTIQPGLPQPRASLGRRRRAQAADADPALAGAVHHRGARPRLGRGGAGRPRAARSCAGGSATRSTRAWPCARTWSCAGCTRRRARPRSSPRHESGLRWRSGDDFDAFLAARRGRLLRAQRRRLLHRPPDGLVPDGLGPGGSRWPTARASCTTPRACGSATPRRSRRRRA